MSITVRDVEAEGVRYSVMSGNITGADLIEAYRPRPGARGDAPARGLVDMREVRTLDVTSSAIWELTQLLVRADPSAKPARVAIVARADFTFGMARMFEALAESAGVKTQYHVFRDMAEARAWLGLGPDAKAGGEV